MASAHSKFQSFVPLCGWYILFLEPMSPHKHYPKQVKCSFLQLLKTYMCPGFPKVRLLPQQASHQALGLYFHKRFSLRSVSNTVALQCGIFNKENFVFSVYSRAKFYGVSCFSCTDDFPSFKELLVFPTMMCSGLMSIKPDMGRTKFFPAELCQYDF
jgi:hypothetical protein